LEYFCAWYFVEQFEVKQTITLADIQQQIFAPHWQNPTWHEVLSLIVGMISERFAKEMIEYLMKQDSQAHEYRNLFLAVQCLADVRNIGVLQSTILELANQLNRVADGTVNASDAVRNHAREAISILHSL
jgi:predicted NACHT family NTPase